MRRAQAVESEPTPPAWQHGAALLFVLAYVLIIDRNASPYDDSFFFKRFALNLLARGQWSWNLADGPVYGLTSQLFGAAAVGLTWLFPSYFVLSSKVFLGACVAALTGLVLRFAARTGVAATDAGLLVLLSLGTPMVLLEPHTGMETSGCLLLLAGALMAVLRADTSAGRSVRAALWTVLVYLCRPDAALLPALTFVLVRREDWRALLRFGIVLSAALALLLCAFRFYYGTALPLPFYAKTAGLSAYDRELRASGVHGKLQHVLTFAAFSAPLAWIAAHGRDARVRALLLASGVFIAYQALITNEIMGYRARFYAPALVPLLLAALLAWPRASARDLARSAASAWLVWVVLVLGAYAIGLVARAGDAPLERLPGSAYGAQLFLGVLLCDRLRQRPRLSSQSATVASIAVLALATVLLRPVRSAHAARADATRANSQGARETLSDAAFLERASAEVTTTRGLFDVFRCIPGPHTLYHSEIGIPGLLLPDWRIVDLVGLMSRQVALEHPPFDQYCLRDRPTVLFLPHRNYRALNAEIRASACLRDYRLMVSDSASPLYVRRDLSDSFRACRSEPWQSE